jgi:hypothetical protein
MKPIYWIIIILTFVIISYMNKETIKKFVSRGYANANPGNIRLTKDSKGDTVLWQGEILGKDKAFKTFKSMVWGYRAIFVLLRTYINRGINTIEKIVNTYAPPNENNTKSYVNFVASKLGKPSNTVVSLTDLNTLTQLVAAISQMENGLAPNMDEVKEGLRLFQTT